MKILIVVLTLFSSVSFAEVLPYKTDLVALATRYRALHTCNCLYVMKMNQDYCTTYSKVDPPIFTVVIDAANKSVSSGVSGQPIKPALAKFENERTGCRIQTN